MREIFDRIADHSIGLSRGEEVLACGFSGEESGFARLSRSAVRQAGSVRQMFLQLELISGLRHAQASVSLSGRWGEDRSRVERVVVELREMLPDLPEDPHLIFASDNGSSEQAGEDNLPPQGEALDVVLEAGRGKDLVGIFSSGCICAGFANSFGQRNWYSSFSFNLDWTFYHRGDKAVKSQHAGNSWEPSVFQTKIQIAETHIDALKRPPKSIPRGRYRVYLSPAALTEFVGMVARSGFGLRARRTKQTSLLKMIEDGRCLNPIVHLKENTREGFGPGFQYQGFPKPPEVPLIEAGAPGGSLVSPRSEKEWGVSSNGASDREFPEAVDMAAGEIPSSSVLGRLERGIYIGDLWYLNYSDLVSCRMTGLTRFATFWVEGGEIQAPINVMRFDETVYRVLGENLIGLTQERDLFLDTGTYQSRSTRSSRMPGALVEDFSLTL